MVRKSLYAQAPNRRETNANALRPAMLRIVDRRIISKGELAFPCIPALEEQYVAKLLGAWSALGRPFSEAEAAQLRELVALALKTGFEATPYAMLLVSYEAEPPP